MVDLALLQSVSYIAGALGVCAAAIYYIINISNAQRSQTHASQTREIDLCRLYLNEVVSEYGNERYATVMNMKWTDYDDFMNKYGYTEQQGYSNPEMFGKWLSMLLTWETLGYILKKELASAETIYSLGAWGCIRGWEKFRDVVVTRRKIPLYGPNYFANFEFLAGEMVRVKSEGEGFDPGRVLSESQVF